MPDLLPSVRDELAWAAVRLGEVAVGDSRREARVIWRAVTDVGRYRAAVERRARGEPLAYACGTAGFRRLTLLSDARALIPRPESEGLVELALRLRDEGRVLDLGTGSGCLALALADEGSYRQVVGVDVSPGAIALARENATRTALDIDWRTGPWCAPVAGMRFDLVVCNPPYLTSREMLAIDPAVGEWEPSLALDGGADGLRSTATVLNEVEGILSPGGYLALEVDARRAEATSVLASRGPWEGVTITEDLYGRSRYLTARRGSTTHD